ncbi:DUF3072 domain-containing protein [Nocardioides marmotae]|nr:DUF3072 domain-containing protein [Nocardioides marmotae]MBC9735386.1 DUF3072 domain-containing protein [Nocardioides marmotae]MTB86484.1 DUF3072 domain-containing protein [Nocardioides marmotae]
MSDSNTDANAAMNVSADLTKAEASEHIDRLQQATGRGADA